VKSEVLMVFFVGFIDLVSIEKISHFTHRLFSQAEGE